MRGAAQAASVRGIPETRNGHWPGQGMLVVVLAEFRRAFTAAQRYEHLRYRNADHESIASRDIPWRVFREFYFTEGIVERGVQLPSPTHSCADHGRREPKS
jgi:hypothetical protein